MESKIIFMGEEYADALFITTKVKVSLWGRIKNIFCPEIQFGYTVYTKEAVPKYQVKPEIRSFSYWGIWRRTLKSKGMGILSEAATLQEAKDYVAKAEQNNV